MHEESGDEVRKNAESTPIWRAWIMTLVVVAFVVGCSVLVVNNIFLPLDGVEHYTPFPSR